MHHGTMQCIGRTPPMPHLQQQAGHVNMGGRAVTARGVRAA